MSDLLKKLLAVQIELKAPKNQKNSFGGYNYRSCEDILEAVKPLCQKHGCVIMLTDEVVNCGDWHYIRAKARFFDIETGDAVENTAYARESEQKKGSDASQITGAASSYARKYALNGLFCIDDEKDADTDEYKRSMDAKGASKPADAQEHISCKKCGAEIKPVKKGTQTLTGAMVAQQTGGMCLKCYKAAK